MKFENRAITEAIKKIYDSAIHHVCGFVAVGRDNHRRRFKSDKEITEKKEEDISIHTKEDLKPSVMELWKAMRKWRVKLSPCWRNHWPTGRRKRKFAGWDGRWKNNMIDRETIYGGMKTDPASSIKI